MRGVGQTLSRLPAARAFIAGAAILAGSLPASPSVRAAAMPDDTAFANPRLPPGGAGAGLDGAGLPQPLAPSDASRLRRAFSLQLAGNIAAASAEMAGVSTPLLTGHLLAQRYLGRFTQPTSAELATWLARYPDHPDASAVHTLLLSRLAGGMARPPDPAVSGLSPQAPAAPEPEENSPATARLPRNPLLDRTVHERARAGNFDSALSLLMKTKGLDALYGGQLRAEIAQTLFSLGRDEPALRLAEGALRQSGGKIGLAGYVGGLAAWRLERPAEAQWLFEAANRAEYASPSLQAAAAFWAARAHLRTRDYPGFAPWMRRAAEARHTFYGLLARRSLGLGQSPDTTRDTLGAADVDAMMANPHGVRAFALLQVGQPGRAEAELRCLWPEVSGDTGLSGAVMRVAEAAGLTDLAAQLAGLIETAEGRPHDRARFPIPALRPAGGFKMDPALVYALTRLGIEFRPGRRIQRRCARVDAGHARDSQLHGRRWRCAGEPLLSPPA